MAKITYNVSTASIPQVLNQFMRFIGQPQLKARLKRIQQKFPRGGQHSSAMARRYAIPIGLNRVYGRSASAPRGLADHDGGVSYKAISFAAAAVEVSRHLGPAARNILRGRVMDSLTAAGDARSLAHEFRVITTLARRGWDIEFTDFEQRAHYDFIARQDEREIEIECKNITADCGSAVHVEDFEALANDLKNNILSNQHDNLVVRVDVALADRLPRKQEQRKLMVQAVMGLLNRNSSGAAEMLGVSITARFLEVSPVDVNNVESSTINALREIGDEHNGAVVGISSKTEFIAIHVYSQRKSKVQDSVIRVFKDAASQLSYQRPGIIWAHFSDLENAELDDLIKIYRSGQFTLLQEIALKLFSEARYAHLAALFFSGEAPVQRRGGPGSLILHPPYYSQNGILYPLWNRNCSLNKPFKELM